MIHVEENHHFIRNTKGILFDTVSVSLDIPHATHDKHDIRWKKQKMYMYKYTIQGGGGKKAHSHS